MFKNRTPQSPQAIARSVRRFTMSVLALLGYVPRYLPPRAQQAAIERLAARGRTPIFVDVTHRTIRELARIVGELASEAQRTHSRRIRRDLARYTAIFAVSIYGYLEANGVVTEGTDEALIAAVRFANENVLGLAARDTSMVDESTNEAMDCLTDENRDRGARELASALRGMYRVRTRVEQVMARKWLIAGVGIALGVSGCVLAGR